MSITFKRNKDQPEELVTWKFKINLAASYLPESMPPTAPAEQILAPKS